MRVLILNHNVAFRGGATFYRAFHIGKGLTERGHYVTLIASTAKWRLRFNSICYGNMRLLEVPSLLPPRWRYGYDYYEALRRISWIGKSEYDIIQAFDSRPVVIYPALFSQNQGARLVMDWSDWFGRGGAVEERKNSITRFILRYLETYYEENFRKKADANTVINSSLEKRAITLGVDPETILRLPNGSDPTKLYPLDRDELRLSLGLPINVPILGYMGSLFPNDAILLAQAFSILRVEQPEALIILMGNPKADVQISDGLIRTGFISYYDLNRYLAVCDLLWLPLSDSLANRGRWPSKITDYFAVGRPTVSCAVGDIPEVFAETQAGVATEPTPESLASASLSLLDDPDLLQRLGMNARRAAETRYNWNSLIKTVENMYLNILEK
jgi:glycosyltransferase involved in cell wall biosynthesis